MKKLPDSELGAIIDRAIAMAEPPVPDLVIEFEELDLDSPMPAAMKQSPPDAAPAAVPNRSVKITIRIPSRVLAAFRAQAVNTKVPYQRLMNRALQAACLNRS